MSIKITIEVTDTFSGEANYCWVRRGSALIAETNDNETSRQREKRFRRAVAKHVRELSGWHVSTRIAIESMGCGYEVRPRGLHQVAFVEIDG